ncbi:GNAT family N-acetyltransferase [Sporosarcina sp. E16_3]|uniref:GNAT family N-acetyltransferase n=1 Tax=Sporosarcina sp. E16_3 TaxID=2789293 RepID=UPI001A913556|nr:GNAT family N-acetyltransferase [Sporosarcina sp. E16_3]MBO0603090.1 GNAT family N-acetyltransferase [Sporosarcina sp. E16_3]
MTTTITITPPSDIRDLAVFLEKMNKISSSHVGYCGEAEEEIYQTLLHDFSDLDLSQSFAVAYEKGCIVGAVGVDIDKAEFSAEVWGPFIDDKIDDPNVIDELLAAVISYSSIQLKHISFFLNKKNSRGKEFVLKHGGVEKGHHAILLARRDELGEVDVDELEKYSPPYEQTFSALHEAEFPSTYYSAQEILSRQNDMNQLFIMTSGDQCIKGYVYIEAQPQHNEGSIEYIAVSIQNRKQGVGAKLMKFALVNLFSFNEIEKISLCVEKENESALKLYLAAGFKMRHELIHFQTTFPGFEEVFHDNKK